MENATRAGHGLKFPGARIPGFIAMGTFLVLASDEKIFAIVHDTTQRGIKICFTGTAFETWIVGAKDPKRVVSTLGVEPDGCFL